MRLRFAVRKETINMGVISTHGKAMRILKIAALVSGAAILLVVGAATALLSRFDADWLKQEAVRLVKEKQQRDLRIDGGIELSIFPGLGFRTGRVVLAEKHTADEFVSVQSVRATIRLLPLLSRQLVMDRVELEGVRLNLVRHRDGSFNFDDLLVQHDAAPAAVEPDIRGFSVRDAVVAYRDEATERQWRFETLNLETGRLAKVAHGDLQLSGRMADTASAMPVELLARYDYDADRRRASLSKIKIRIGDQASGLRHLDAEVAIAALQLDGASRSLQLIDALLEHRAQLSDGRFHVRLLVPALQMQDGLIRTEAAQGSLQLAGEARRLDVQLTLSALAGRADDLRADRLGLQWTWTQGPLTLRGGLAGALQGDLTARQLALPNLSGEMQVAHPDLSMKTLVLPLNGAFESDLAQSTLAGRMATRFDETAMQGKWSATRLAPLALAIELDVDRLNVDRYFPARDGSPAPGLPATASQKGGEASDRPLSSTGSRLAGVLRIGALQVRNVSIRQFRADLRLEDGKLDIAPAAGMTRTPPGSERISGAKLTR